MILFRSVNRALGPALVLLGFATPAAAQTLGARWMSPAPDARAHGRDERMRIQSYYEGQELLYRLTKLLATNGAPVP